MSKNSDKWIFRKFVSEAISLATYDKTITIQSLVFPAIGCGNIGCDPDFVAKTLIMAVSYEFRKQPSLQLDVYFVIQQHQQNVIDAFRNELKIFKNNAPNPSSGMKTPLIQNAPRRHENKEEFNIEKREILPSSDEYKTIVNEFRSTMTSTLFKQIVRVELVWNKRWYRQYMTHKDAFFQRLKKDTEKQLFHGCAESAANNIIQNCFDRSYAGQHGMYELIN